MRAVNANDSAGFGAGGGAHVLMITNHGVHEWHVTPGLPDTGGQNVYVNQFTNALVAQGYRVTVVNRGGYPHPVTGEPQVGAVYHPNGRARILYLEDGTPAFVRKEDMDEHIPDLVTDLERKLAAEGIGFDLILSHYWDAGKLGAALTERIGNRAPHVWVPHSLGALKKRNMDPTTWADLRIDERIEHERMLVPRVDGVVSTSAAISGSLVDDYGHQPAYILPPCVDVERFHPRDPAECEGIWGFLSRHSALGVSELKSRRLVTEISRTDRTKRKDVLIRAFAAVRYRLPGVLLVVSLDPRAGPPYDEAMGLIADLGVGEDVVVLGSVWDELPCLYSVTSVYCTPSVMEGFGMSAQEAAATAVPVVASDLVPFAVEYLLGEEPTRLPLDDRHPKRQVVVGDGAAVVPADDVEGFAEALSLLLSDDVQRTRMGRRALDITVPYFTWERRTADLLDHLGVTAEAVRP
jgi:glycosyltransferase involved in cell wall biosynthesis